MTHQSIRALPPIREARALFLVHVRLNPRLYPMKSVSGSFWRNYVGADVSLAENKDPHKLAEMEGGDGR